MKIIASILTVYLKVSVWLASRRLKREMKRQKLHFPEERPDGEIEIMKKHISSNEDTHLFI